MANENDQGGLKSAAIPGKLRQDQSREDSQREDALAEPVADELVDPLKDPLLVDLPDGSGPGAGDPDPADGGGGGGDDPVQMDNGGGPFDGWGPAAFGAIQKLGGPVQQSGDGGSGDIQRIASEGIKGSSSSLPHLDTIQQSFGGHDVSGVKAHTGGSAKSAASAMGASAYATGNDVAFGNTPDLHTAAHEAAHVVQQRSGVNVPGGVGQVGDRYEKNADSVADAVVQGRSAEPLLSQMSGSAPNATDAANVQRKAVQMGWLGDAIEWGAGVIRRGVEAVFRWIDLMAAKGRLLAKICDTAWVTKAASGVKANPHPKHQNRLSLSILGITLLCRLEAMSHALRIAGCDSLKQVEALSKAVDKWQAKRGITLKKEIEDKIDEYRKDEAKWLTTYTSHGALEQLDAHPNKGSDKADIRLDPGMISKATLTSRLKISWNHTKKAKKAGLDKKKPWTAKQKAGMLAKVQKQLDAVWGPGNQMKPFKIIEPQDYLLEKSAQRWSAVLGTFHPKIVEDSKKGSTEIAIWREAKGEHNRANSANLYEQDVKANYKKNKDGTFAPAQMEGLSNQHTQAHEFGHFGMGLPDEYNETGKTTGIKPWQKQFKKVIKDYDKKIAKLKKTLAKHPVKTDADKKAKKELETKLLWYNKDRKALLSPWSRSYGKGKWKDKQPDMYILAPQNRPKNAPAPPPNEAFARWGDAGDVYAPGKRSARGQRENAFHTKDTVRIMNSGNRVEPYAYEGILELINALVVGKFDPSVKFEHNVKKGSNEWKVVQDVRKWNLKVDMGKAKAKGAAPGKAKEKVYDH